MPHDASDLSRSRTGLRVLMIFSVALGTICLVCCGGPTIAYFVVKRSITAQLEAPATPEPLSPNELFQWYRANKPTEPFAWHDPTRYDVELTGTVLEANRGPQLRRPAVSEKYRTLLTDMEPRERDRYTSFGQSQLIFHGEQDNQEVVCWFEHTEAIEGVSPGDRIVVRGRRREMVSMSDDGSFVLQLVRCRRT
ncbi:MAG: hypothetical protein RIC55_17030 [Pirellulaceae bacterium]